MHCVTKLILMYWHSLSSRKFMLIFSPNTRCLLKFSLKNLKIKIYNTIILPVVLYGCEKWPLTLREVCRIKVFENRNRRRIFGPKRDENVERRRLYSEELHRLYRSLNIVRVIKSGRLSQKRIRYEYFQNFNRYAYRK